ncbi:MAG: acyl-CoA thioesterase [Candidatus Binataceae bacterium]|nr:acyl-CoA thioesterase [Candidatus Binataceae bacterium]
MITARVAIKIQFYDLDPMRVVWHGNYPRFLEQARSALFEMLGFGYRVMASSKYAYPIVGLQIKYVRPLMPEQTIEVAATLVEYDPRIKIKYVITDAATAAVLTRAHTIQLTIDRTTNELCYETPAIFVERVKQTLCAPR